MTTRETVMHRLFVLLRNSGPYKTSGRRMKFWTDVAAQPALFLRHVSDETKHQGIGMPGFVTMECEAWLYANGGKDEDAVPETELNDLLDAVEAAIAPPPGTDTQTLGGIVLHAFIEGTTKMHPGDIGGQAIAVVPIKVIVPNFTGA